MASTELRAAAQQALEALLDDCLVQVGPHSWERRSDLAITALRAALAEPEEGGRTHVGDSAFESWFATYNPAGKSDKQRARDAYAAGMGDLSAPAAQTDDKPDSVDLAQPEQEPVADRAAFEHHAQRLGYSVDPDTREGREGGYWSSHTHLMWETWQAAMAQRAAQPVQEPDDKAASIRWQLCLLAQTEEFSDDVRNQIGRGVWLIDRLTEAALAEPQEPDDPARRCGGPGCDMRCCQPVQQGCDHCNHPLYAAVKCRVCGRVTEPVQEPVAWDGTCMLGHCNSPAGCENSGECRAGAAPPQRKPLPASDIVTMYDEHPMGDSDMIEFARAIERAHGIGGEG